VPLELSLVIPAYNEQARLPYTLAQIEQYLCQHQLAAEVIVVDNGSHDATSAVVQQAAIRFRGLRLLRLDRRGKGCAVRAGVLAATGAVVIFGDADLSWAVEDLGRFRALVEAGHPVVIGSREGLGSRRIGEPFYRHLMGRVFNRVVQLLAVPGVEDSQCGFKAFSADAAQAIFSRQRIDGFGFDVEVLYLARRLGFGVMVLPLSWEHKQNSRVAPVRDTLRMLSDVVRVRLNASRGVYA
jgi:glycosyltransferase involved in cell wall biosynthesis